jgi:nucleoside-diphosphate-sugar epimerase
VRVLVAGGTGAIGKPLVRKLVEAGHEVTATTRHPAKRAGIESAGARTAVADALDPGAVRATVGEARPEVVIDVLTALPPRGPMRAGDFPATNRLRTEGTGNVLEAAIEGGARRYVGESIVLMYAPADSPADEGSPLLDPDLLPRGLADAYRAALAKERMILDAAREGRIEGLILRYGAFYGPQAGAIEYLVKLARRRLLALPAGGPGVIPWIHVEDAAAATVAAAARGRSGQIYNVVDDGEVTFGTFTKELTARMGLPAPSSIPTWMVRPLAPYGARLMAEARLRVSNDKAKRELDWTPSFRTFREGLAHVAAALAPSAT